MNSYEAAYSPDYGRLLKHTPSPPSVVSVVVLVVSIVLGLVVSFIVPFEFGWTLALTTAMAVIGFIGFAWMQDVSVGRRVWATVLAILAIWPATAGLAVAAWILVRRRSLVPLVTVPFSVVGVAAVLVLLFDREVNAGVGIGTLALLIALSVFAWIAVGIDKLIRNPTVPAAYRHTTPAFVQIGQTPTGEPLYGYVTPGPHAYQATSESLNTMAVLSLIFGLFGSGIVAVILGHMAHGQIRRTAERGTGMATAGLILGYLAVVVYIAIIVVYAIVIANAFS